MTAQVAIELIFNTPVRVFYYYIPFYLYRLLNGLHNRTMVKILYNMVYFLPLTGPTPTALHSLKEEYH